MATREELKRFQLKSFWVRTESRGIVEQKMYDWGETACEACIKVEIFGVEEEPVEEHRAGEGDGPVNALDNALRKCLLPYFGFLEEVSIIDYKVKIVDKKEGTASAVIVRILFCAHGRKWAVEEESTDIINASLHSLIDGYRKALYAFSGQTSRLVGEIFAS